MVEVLDRVRILDQNFLSGEIGIVITVDTVDPRYWVETGGARYWVQDVELVEPAVLKSFQTHFEKFEDDPISPRAEVLDTAKFLVLGDRNNTYGPPTQDFQRTTGVLNALGFRKTGPDGSIVELESHDVAAILAAVKLSRLQWSPEKKDHWIDLAGYAACGYECVAENVEDDE